MRDVLKAKVFGPGNAKLMGIGGAKGKLMLINVSAKGRHRSVANAEIQENYSTSKTKGEVYVCHISQYDFWGKTCRGTCSECSTNSVRHRTESILSMMHRP